MNHFTSSGSVLGSPAGFNLSRVLDELFCYGDLFVTNNKVRDHGEGIAGKGDNHDLLEHHSSQEMSLYPSFLFYLRLSLELMTASSLHVIFFFNLSGIKQ